MTDEQQVPEPDYVSPAAGIEAWGAAAYEALLEAAHHYGETVTYADLAALVQERTGLATRAEPRHWIGQVLSQVSRRCAEKNLPPQTSLAVVRADAGARTLGPGSEVGEILARREQAAAVARLRCYRRFAPDIPDDVVRAFAVEERERAAQEAARTRAGGARKPAAARAPRAAAAPAARTPRRTEREPTICPTCFTALPATGICDTCG